MPATLNDKLVIAISSRALFNLDESHQVYQKEGLEAYSKYQVAQRGRTAASRGGVSPGHKLLA